MHASDIALRCRFCERKHQLATAGHQCFGHLPWEAGTVSMECFPQEIMQHVIGPERGRSWVFEANTQAGAQVGTGDHEEVPFFSSQKGGLNVETRSGTGLEVRAVGTTYQTLLRFGPNDMEAGKLAGRSRAFRKGSPSMRRWLLITMLLVSLIGGAAQARAQESAFPAMPLDELGLPEVVVTSDGSTMALPGELDAGRYYLELDNTSATASIAVEFYRAPDGTEAAGLIPSFQDAAAVDQPPPGFYENLIAGGVSAEPGRTGQAVIDLPAGSWIAAAFIYGGVDGFLAQSVEVTGDFGDPDDPDSDIDVNFVDFSFDFGKGLRSGNLVWELENDGTQPHFISIYTYPGELTEAGVNAAIAAAYGTSAEPVDPAATPIDLEQLVEIGGSGTMSPDTEAWLQLDLPPGTYLALCQVADRESGLPHSALGQFAVFTVE